MKKYVIIVAGGKGLRMGSDLPKQFLPMGDKPVLMHTLEVFRRYDEALQIILVLPQEQQSFWKQLCDEHHFTVKHVLAEGGETRFHSVKNGLALVQEPGLVGVHDGVRPFVSVEVIRRCYELAEVQKAVIPVVDVVETLRHLTDARIDSLFVECSKTDTYRRQKLMAGMFQIMLIVRIINNPLKVALVITHLHFQFIDIVHQLKIED